MVGLDRGFRGSGASPQVFPISIFFLAEASRSANYNITWMLVLLIDDYQMIGYLNAKLFGFELKNNMLD